MPKGIFSIRANAQRFSICKALRASLMKISVVTAMYQSALHIADFHGRMASALSKVSEDFEVLYVNDGSSDQSLQVAIEIQQSDNRIVVIDLARNFGHHRAMMTGLQHTSGDYIFLIDCDLEESPELFNRFWNEMAADTELDVVYGVQQTRKGGLFENLSGHIWYYLFSFMSSIEYPDNSLTARLMTNRYVENVRRFGEKELELWGIFVLAGFKQKAIQTTKGSKGHTTYTLGRKLRMAVNSITSFSSRPLVASFLLGLVMTFVSFCFVIYFLVLWAVYEKPVEGWTSTLISIWFVGGIIMFSLGVIGIYLSKMFLEIKNRPLTSIRNIYRVK
jgi:putative glycosyltransferase